MNKLRIDKIMILLGIGLLGYYVGLSLLGGIYRSSLWAVLPPINNRHLPDFYPGIMGAVVAITLGYIIYTRYVEKKALTDNKRGYTIALTLLLVLPLVALGAFRVHAVSIVSEAEKTTPTSFHLNLLEAQNSVMFETSPNSATGFNKSIRINADDNWLEAIGNAVREMEIVEVAGSNTQSRGATIWLRYEVNGRGYSKILGYGDGIFTESVANHKTAHYQSPDFEQLLAELLAEAGNLEHFTQARVWNSQLIGPDRENSPIQLKEDELTILINVIKKENLIAPDEEVKRKFTKALQEPLTKENANIYAIELSTDYQAEFQVKNFMVYDYDSKILLFDGKYYQFDLSEIAIIY